MDVSYLGKDPNKLSALISDDYTTNRSDTIASTKCVYNAINDIPESDPSFPAGTQMLFVQAAAPTGWVKQTTVNDSAIRVVSGTTGGNTGGSVAFSTAFVSGKTVSLSGNVGSTTLSVSQIPSHNHSFSALISSREYYLESGYVWGGGSSNTSATGGSGSHTHALSGTAQLNLSVKYLDVILCKKA